MDCHFCYHKYYLFNLFQSSVIPNLLSDVVIQQRLLEFRNENIFIGFFVLLPGPESDYFV
jgi:hypothetical protein